MQDNKRFKFIQVSFPSCWHYSSFRNSKEKTKQKKEKREKREKKVGISLQRCYGFSVTLGTKLRSTLYRLTKKAAYSYCWTYLTKAWFKSFNLSRNSILDSCINSQRDILFQVININLQGKSKGHMLDQESQERSDAH